MGYMKIKPKRRLQADIAQMYGPAVTRREADIIAGKAKSLADARAKHSSVADRIDISAHANGTHHAVIMSVHGRDGKQVATHLEFGYFNEWAQRRLPGMHIMRDAAMGG